MSENECVSEREDGRRGGRQQAGKQPEGGIGEGSGDVEVGRWG